MEIVRKGDMLLPGAYEWQDISKRYTFELKPNTGNLICFCITKRVIDKIDYIQLLYETFIHQKW